MSRLFTKMLGFELRAVIYGNDLDGKPFVDLRRKGGVYTVNAIHELVESEVIIGRRWFRRNIKEYAHAALQRLDETKEKMYSNREYTERIRINNLWEIQ
jgi:hypothetical protein